MSNRRPRRRGPKITRRLTLPEMHKAAHCTQRERCTGQGCRLRANDREHMNIATKPRKDSEALTKGERRLRDRIRAYMAYGNSDPGYHRPGSVNKPMPAKKHG